jgi:hypothetical protein
MAQLKEERLSQVAESARTRFCRRTSPWFVKRRFRRRAQRRSACSRGDITLTVAAPKFSLSPIGVKRHAAGSQLGLRFHGDPPFGRCFSKVCATERRLALARDRNDDDGDLLRIFQILRFAGLCQNVVIWKRCRRPCGATIRPVCATHHSGECPLDDVRRLRLSQRLLAETNFPRR